MSERAYHHLPEGFSTEGMHEGYGPEAKYAVAAEAALPTTRWEEEVRRGLEYGLPGADSIVDKRIPTFSRGALPLPTGWSAAPPRPPPRTWPRARSPRACPRC